MAVGWGIPAALISICVGFKYEEYGGEVYFSILITVKVLKEGILYRCSNT